MYTSLDDPQEFLRHDVRFHRAVATGSNNLVLSALIEMVASLHYEQRRVTIERARNELRSEADMHRRIYQAVRSRDPEAARAAMDEHLQRAARPDGLGGDRSRPRSGAGTQERSAHEKRCRLVLGRARAGDERRGSARRRAPRRRVPSRSRRSRRGSPGSARRSSACSSTGASTRSRRASGRASAFPASASGSCSAPKSRWPSTRSSPGSFNPVKFDADGLGGHGAGRRHEVHRDHVEAPRRLRALRLEGEPLRRRRRDALRGATS